VEQVLFTFPEHLSLPPVVSGVRVTRSLVLCVCAVDHFVLYFFFWPLCCLSFDLRIRLPLWYLQTLLKHSENANSVVSCVFGGNEIPKSIQCKVDNTDMMLLFTPV
jgi:hypothetical protein